MPKLLINGMSMTFEVDRPDARSDGKSEAGAEACAPSTNDDQPQAGDKGINRPHQGIPLVLLHGFPLNERVWADVSAIVGRTHTVIRPNLRGFGQLTNADPFTIESLADDVHAFLRETGASPAVVAGLSMGGYVAFALAKKYPADLAGLALVDTRAEADTPEARAKRDELIQRLHSGGPRAVADLMFPNLLSPRTCQERPAIGDVLMRVMLDTPAPTIEHALLAMRDRPDATATLTDLSVPTAVIVGEDDKLTPPALAEAMAAQIPKAQLEIIPGAGHLAVLERPERVAQALLRLMNRVNGS